MAWYAKVQYLDYVTYNQDEMAAERLSSIGDYIEDGGFEISKINGDAIHINGGFAHIGGFYMKVIEDSVPINTSGKKFIGMKITSIPAANSNSVGIVDVKPYVHPTNNEADFDKVKNKWVNGSYVYHIFTKNDDGTFTRENTSKNYTTIDNVELFSTGGKLWFNVNGHDSNKLAIDFTGITQRVLTLNDIGLKDEDLPDKEDNDEFLNVLLEKIPTDSIFTEYALSTSNLSKNFPFNSWGNIKITKTTNSTADIQFNIIGGKSDLSAPNSGNGTLGIITDTHNVSRGDVWSMVAEKKNGVWSTPGYTMINDRGTSIITHRLSSKQERAYFPVDSFDTFELSLKASADDKLQNSLILNYEQLQNSFFLTGFFASSTSTSLYHVQRETRLTRTFIETGLKKGQQSSTMGAYVLIKCKKKYLFKNSKSVAWDLFYSDTKDVNNILDYNPAYEI